MKSIATDGWSYAIAQDGKRLLVAQPAQAERPRSIFVLTNWPHRMTASR